MPTDERPAAVTDEKSLLSELARGAREAFANAEQLFGEAVLCTATGH